MIVNKYKIYTSALFTAAFFTFSGYFCLLILSSNLLGTGYSRYFTIPVRILIVALLFICVDLSGIKQYINKPVFIAFLAFSLLYIGRIAVDSINGVKNHMGGDEFLLFYLSFCFFPFVFLFLKKSSSVDLKLYRWAILSSGAMLSIFTFVFYRDIIGTVGRISLAVSKDENYISPLALSYSGSLTMGVAMLLLLTHKNAKSTKLILWVIAGMACIPFFLGASRGSVLALSVPFILFILNHKSKVTSIYLLIAFTLLSFGIIILSEQFGSALVERFMGIESGIESGSSAASRVDIWNSALNHFYNSPIFGNSLEVPETQYHPHNIFIEVLMSTGIIGFIPFIYMIGKTLQQILWIFKNRPQLSWVAAIFLQSLIQNCFSGAIYGSSWMFFSMAFILSMNLKEENSIRQRTFFYNRKRLEAETIGR